MNKYPVLLMMAICLSVGTSLAQPMHGNYTINSAVATGGTNFKSFTDAVSALVSAGVDGAVVLDVKAGSGPYAEATVIDSIPGTSAANTITFNGNGNTLKFKSSQDLFKRTVLQLHGADYLIFNNLTIDARADAGQTYMGIALHLFKDADNNTFDHCHIISDSTNPSFQGSYPYTVVISGDANAVYTFEPSLCDNNVFSNDTIQGGYMAILIRGKDGASKNNQFINNYISSFNFCGMYINDIENTLIEKNHFDLPVRKKTGGVVCIQLVNASTNTIISKNRFTNPYDGHPENAAFRYEAIDEGGSDDLPNTGTIIANNIIYNVGMSEAFSGIVSGSSASIYNNTIDIDYTGPAEGYAYGIRLINDGMNATIKNNIIKIANNSSAKAYGIYAYETVPSVNADYNDYYFTGSGQTYTGSSGGYDYVSLDDWKAASTVESHSVNINPLFKDALSGNLRFNARDLDNLGEPVAVSTDFVDVTRSTSTPDMGAFETTTLPCQPLRGVYSINADAAPGTARTFVSFNDAYDALRCGIDSAVIFNVTTTKHIYKEQLNMEAIQGASAVNTVTFNGNGNTIKFSSADIQKQAVILFYGTSHVIFDSLIVDATPMEVDRMNRFGLGMQLYNDADDNIIRKCTVLTDSTFQHFVTDWRHVYNGIVLRGNDVSELVSTDHNQFISNNVSGGNYGIQLLGLSIGDKFINNNITAFDTYGILLGRPGGRNGQPFNDSLLVMGNDVQGSTNGLVCIGVSESDNSIITRNTVHDMPSNYVIGIQISNANNDEHSKSVISNNLIYNMGSPDVMVVTGIQANTIGFTDVVHNTVVLKNNSTFDGANITGFNSAIWPEPGITTIVTFKNNIISISGEGKGAGSIMDIGPFDLDYRDMFDMDYNNYNLDSNPQNQIAFLHLNTDPFIMLIPAIADWRLLSKKDSNTVNIDPKFTDVAAGNYRPTSKEMDNLGKPVGILIDKDSVSRSSTKPDLGAYEYNSCLPGFARFTASNFQPCINENVFFKSVDTLSDGSTVNKWEWSFDNDATANQSTASTTYTKEGQYNVKLTATTNTGCTDDTTQTITVVDCEKQLFIPNAFSPNNDGTNDILQVYGKDIKEMTLMIYNQWGEKLFESHNTAAGWDGKQNGKIQPAGVYMYVCKVVLTNGKETTRKGSINLVR